MSCPWRLVFQEENRGSHETMIVTSDSIETKAPNDCLKDEVDDGLSGRETPFSPFLSFSLLYSSHPLLSSPGQLIGLQKGNRFTMPETNCRLASCIRES